jgi:hypothetical protein
MNPARLRREWAQLGQLKRSISLQFGIAQSFIGAADWSMVAQMFMLNLV